jgi:hypothetical protein
MFDVLQPLSSHPIGGAVGQPGLDTSGATSYVPGRAKRRLVSGRDGLMNLLQFDLRRMGTSLSRALITGALAACVAVCVSCSSSKARAKPFASVTIVNQSRATIRETVDAVFAAEGYVEAAKAGGWAYERRGGGMSQLVHGGWFDGEAVRERVKLLLVPLADGSHRLECNAVMVRYAGDMFFEEETRMTRLRSTPYQKLLKNVERRLRNLSGAAPPP